MDGLRLGLTAAAVVTAGVAVSTAIPAVRAGMAARVLPTSWWKWLLVDIPIGTVWTEEAIYRGALGTVAAEAFGPGPGRLLQAVIFGLSHIPDARGAGEPVLGTVVVTGAAGWVFGWLATRSGSLLAPALAHLAINEAGALAALLVQRREVRLARRGRHVPAVRLE
jgi:membrane protease YdiL (CAAX protease family)